MAPLRIGTLTGDARRVDEPVPGVKAPMPPDDACSPEPGDRDRRPDRYRNLTTTDPTAWSCQACRLPSHMGESAFNNPGITST